MEEDEDVIVENSAFLQHLQDIGIDSFETQCSEKFSLHQKLPRKPPKKTNVDQSVLEIAAIIKSCNLLFEDDQEHLESVFQNFQESKTETFREMFRGRSSALVVFLCLFLFLYIGYFSFVLVSMFYTYRTTHSLWLKHRQSSRLKRLIAIFTVNFKLLNRVIKFLHENETMLKMKFGDNHASKASQQFVTLKGDLRKVQENVNSLLVESTLTLIKNVPLSNLLDCSDSYLCTQLPIDSNDISLSQQYNIYLLLQSQFLTRLALSSVPALVAHPDASQNVVQSVMLRAAVRLKELYKNLNEKYKFVSQRGICSEQTSRPLPTQKTRSSKDDSLVRNIHDLSNSLQYSLIRARELEANLDVEESDKSAALTELEAIQQELSSCRQHIEDILIFQKRQGSPAHEPNPCIQKIDVVDSGIATEIGLSDLDPKVDDDIFEAVIEDTTETDDNPDWHVEDVDPLAKKKRREVLGELKTKLKEKADDWAIRESKVLERKGLPPAEYTNEECNPPESEEEEEFYVKKRPKCQRYYEENDVEQEVKSIAPIFGHNLGVSMQALLLARSQMNSQGNEEFCGLGENSDVGLESDSEPDEPFMKGLGK